jgi:hypothetical protein
VVRSPAITRTSSWLRSEYSTAERLQLVSSAIRVGCSSGCRVGSVVFRGREEAQLL